MREAVCLLCRRADGKILAVSRPGRPDQFGLPGGKIEPGETPEQALVREVKEETGLVITNLTLVFELVCKGEVDFLSKVYSADLDVTAELHTDEAIEPKWVDPQVLIDGPFGDFNSQLFKAAKITP